MPKARLFVVEDQALIAMELIDHLTRFGYEICGHATRGETATQEILQARPDLILMDINLGSGISGVEVATQVGATRDTPIIFLTAYADAELADCAVKPNTFAYLVKPFRPDALRANIEMTLGKHRAESALIESNRKLAEAEARFRRVTEHVSDALIVDDCNGKVTFANESFFRLFGICPITVDNLRMDQFVAPAWHEELRRDQKLRLAGKPAPTEFEFEGIQHNGEHLWIQATVVPVHGDDGAIIGTQAALRDITDRKRTDSALEFLSSGLARLSGNELFEAIALKLSHLLSVEIGTVAAFDLSTPVKVRTLGLSVDGEVLSNVEFNRVGSPCESSAAAGVSIHSDCVRERFPKMKQLEDWQVESCACIRLLNSKGNVIGALGVMSRKPLEDTKLVRSLLRMFAVRTAAEIERRQAELKFENLFEFAPDAVFMVGEDGRIALANQRAEQMFGYSREEFEGRKIESLIPIPAREGHSQRMSEYFKAPDLRHMGARIARLHALRKDGTVFPVDTSLSPLHSDPGLLIITVVRDISERVEAEEQRAALETELHQAQKIEAVGRLAGGIAHDFNNLLTTMVVNLDVARREIGPAHQATECLDELEAASTRATQLVKQILAFSRQQTADRTQSSLEPLVTEVAKFLQATLPDSISLKVTIDPSTPTTLVDTLQIHQVLMNLGTNAIHALQGKQGEIRFALDQVTADGSGIEHPKLQAGKYARITVADNGEGMSNDVLESIFDPFFTSKKTGEGTGLGLSIVHGVIHEHGGLITVESRPGEGATFRVYLPASDTESISQPESIEEPPLSQKKHLLYIDDDEAVVKATTKLIQHLGYRVTGMTSAMEAIETVRMNPQQFDMVITDYNMPEMMGIKLARDIIDIRPNIPVIMVSGYQDWTDEELESSGVRHSIGKPFGSKQLEEVLGGVFAET